MNENNINSSVYTVYHISEIYSKSVYSLEETHISRYDEISKRFSKIYGCEIEYFVRSPGFLNIIGDPLKFYGYNPISISLEQDIIFGFSITNKNEIRINNSQSVIYPEITIKTDVFQKYQDDNMYFNYIIGGYKAALNESFIFTPKGLNIFISSNLPIKNGFSSSTSLMTGMCLVTLFSNNLIKKMGGESLIEELIKNEKIFTPIINSKNHFYTTNLTKKENLFLLENEAPLSYNNFEIPDNYCLLIAQTLTPMPSLLIKGKRQNKRLCECRIGLCLMMKKLNMENYNEIKTLKEFQNILSYDFEEMIILLKDSIKETNYKTDELEKIFGFPLIQLISDIPYSELVIQSNFDYSPFLRCFHILTEGLRIEQMKILFSEQKSSEEKIKKIIELMNESYISEKDNFECISEEALELKKVLDSYGVLGCRLSSDGWGGPMIGFVDRTKIKIIIDSIMKEYYLSEKNKIFINDDLNMIIFASVASGSCICFDPKYEIWF